MFRLCVALCACFALSLSAQAQCIDSWQSAGLPSAGTPSCATEWDVDGPGGEPPRLVVGGQGFFGPGIPPGTRLLALTENGWEPLDLPGSIPAVLASYQGDLYIGLQFPATINGVTSGLVRIRAGVTETIPGPNSAAALHVHNGLLYVGGGFAFPVGAGTAFNIAAFDGEAWSTLGTGTTAAVRAIGSYQGDLVVGASFGTFGAQPPNRLGRWNGAAWVAAPNALSGDPISFVASNGADLYIGTQFNSIAPSLGLFGAVARWNGAAWSIPGGQPINTGSLRGMRVISGTLYIAGQFSFIGTVQANNIAAWNGVAWSGLGPIPNGVTGTLNGLAEWQGKPAPFGLLFNFANGGPYGMLAYGPGSPPAITRQPFDGVVCLGTTGVLSTVVSGSFPMTYQWRRDGQPLANGPTPWGSTIAGATGPSLSIANFTTFDADSYDCVISNACGGPVTSLAAMLTLRCIADINCDDSVDDLDITAFFAAFEQGAADVNGDETVDDLDISAFFAQFEAGC